MSFPYPSSCYERIALGRPDHLPDAQWEAIAAEAGRLETAIERRDGPQMLGVTKDLMESIARSVYELSGHPAGAKADFAPLVKGATEVLLKQRGHELAYDSIAGQLATSASKMAQKIGTIRNSQGTGHGRAAVPEVTDDGVALALDAGLMWSRWALRRLGLFCIGRPAQILEDLESSWWTKGLLASRLAAADLGDPDVARAIGLGVGRRGARDTWMVVIDGLEAPADSDDLVKWPPAYRWAAAEGHLFTAAGESTLTIKRLHRALRLVKQLLPVDRTSDAADTDAWRDLINRLTTETQPQELQMHDAEENALRILILEIVDLCGPADDGARKLADHFYVSRSTPW